MRTNGEDKQQEHSLSVVIPALNEEGNIQGSIDSVISAYQCNLGHSAIMEAALAKLHITNAGPNRARTLFKFMVAMDT